MMGFSARTPPSSWTSAHRSSRLLARVGGHSTPGLSTRRTTRWLARRIAPTELNPSVWRGNAIHAANDDGRADIVGVLFEIGEAELHEVLVGWNALRSEHPDRVATSAVYHRENAHQLRLTIEELLSLADDEVAR